MTDRVTQDSQFHEPRVRGCRACAYALVMGSVLDDRQIEQYHRDGFLAIEGFVDRAACDELKAAANQIVAEFQPSSERTIFTTTEQERVSNGEFLASGSGVWCFFEEEAFDEHGQPRTSKELSINKIGHAMHDLDPTFEKFSYRPELACVAADIGLADALALQSMYIFKQPLIGGEVACHQDSTFLYTEPLTVTGFWFAIEDATLQNGCLWAKPGGHRTSLRKLFKRAGGSDTDGTIFEELDPAPLPSPSELVPLEVPAGTMVILNGLLPHWSDINRSPTSRHAYSLHCISAAAEYPEWNWLRRAPDMPLRSLAAVAGGVAA
jgi:phytanoyl-CoA hydroxylase